MNSDPKEIFNFEDFLSRMMGDRDLVKAILEEFTSAISGKLETLAGLIDDGNTQEAAVLAHLIKGESASIGAEIMSSEACALEQAAKAGNTDDLRNILPHLLTTAELFMKTVRETVI
jgi:HPt (histidine-containing phosphotransfer) domain-containing protein